MKIFNYNNWAEISNQVNKTFVGRIKKDTASLWVGSETVPTKICHDFGRSAAKPAKM